MGRARSEEEEARGVDLVSVSVERNVSRIPAGAAWAGASRGAGGMKAEWNEKELALLRKLSSTHSARAIAAQLPGCGPWTIRRKIRELGIEGFGEGPNPPWTREQLAALRNLKPGITIAKFARKHGLGRLSVMYRARVMGVHFRPDTELRRQAEARIRELAATHTAREVAAVLGWNHWRVRDWARRMGGVKFNGTARPETRKLALAPEPEKSARARPRENNGTAGHPWKTPRREAPQTLSGERFLQQSVIEWCPECFAPVSNWQEHHERMGHARPMTA